MIDMPQYGIGAGRIPHGFGFPRCERRTAELSTEREVAFVLRHLTRRRAGSRDPGEPPLGGVREEEVGRIPTFRCYVARVLGADDSPMGQQGVRR